MGGKLIPVETCASARGNIGLSWWLFAKKDDPPTAELVATRSRYRSHREHCTETKLRAAGGRSFSGASFTGKKKGSP